MAACTYLDILAIDELSNCVRYLSEKPNSNWYKNMKRSNRILVFDKNGPFARVVSHYITRITVNRALGIQDFIELSARDELGVRILQDWGSCIVEAQIADDISFSRVGNARALIRAVQTHCTSIRRLALNLDFECVWTLNSLLDLYTTQLESLRLSFRALDSFQLNLPTFCNLKLLYVNGPRLQHLSNVFQSSLETLECVTLNGTQTEWTTIISDLYGCINLRNVELKGNVPQEEHAVFLESLGPKLERATMNGMSEELCERVVNSCPNMVSDLVVHTNDLGRMKIVGKRLRKLTLRCTTNSDGIGSMEAATAQCPNISGLYCITSGKIDGPLMHFFICKKRKLESIHLAWFDFISSAKLIRSITSSTENLRLFTMSSNELDFSGLVALLKANQQLEEVNIIERGEKVDNLRHGKVSKILRAMKHHHKLRKLSINFPRTKGVFDIATECVPFRHRRVEVIVCGNVYC